MKDEDRPEIGLDKMGQPIIDPAPDKPPTWETTPAGKATYRGGNWGMLVAFVTGVPLYMSLPLNLSTQATYVGLLLMWLGLGYVLGAFLAWLIGRRTGKNPLPPAGLLD
jgi:hypothetical protein